MEESNSPWSEVSVWCRVPYARGSPRKPPKVDKLGGRGQPLSSLAGVDFPVDTAILLHLIMFLEDFADCRSTDPIMCDKLEIVRLTIAKARLAVRGRVALSRTLLFHQTIELSTPRPQPSSLCNTTNHDPQAQDASCTAVFRTNVAGFMHDEVFEGYQEPLS